MLSMIPPQIMMNPSKQSTVKSAKDISFKEIHSALERIANITDTVVFKPTYEATLNEFYKYTNILSDKLAFVKEEGLAVRYEERSALQAAQKLILTLNNRFDVLSAKINKPASLSATTPSNNDTTEYKLGLTFRLFNPGDGITDLLKLTLKFMDFNQRIAICSINKLTYKNLPLDIQSDKLSKINILTLGCYFIILENNALWKNATYGQLVDIYKLARDEKQTDNSSFFRKKIFKSLEDKAEKKIEKTKHCIIL